MADQPCPRLAVEALGVARLADLERRIDIDLDELALLEQLARHPPLGAERRDERHHDDQTGLHKQLRRLSHAADILHPVRVGKAEILVEPVADIVAVEHVSVPTERVQPLLQHIGDGGLPDLTVR